MAIVARWRIADRSDRPTTPHSPFKRIGRMVLNSRSARDHRVELRCPTVSRSLFAHKSEMTHRA